MKRVFTDQRFPGVEVVNDGDSVFHIIIDGNEEDIFVAYEDPGLEVVSLEFAQRQVKEYFDYLASSGGYDDAWRKDHDGGIAVARSEPKKLDIAHGSNSFEVDIKKPDLDQLVPDSHVMTQDHVDALIAKARAETDPQAREMLRKQALSAMAQLEALSVHLTRTMLS